MFIRTNGFLVFLIAPILGAVLVLFLEEKPVINVDVQPLSVSTDQTMKQLRQTKGKMTETNSLAMETDSLLVSIATQYKEEMNAYGQMQIHVNAIADHSKEQSRENEDVLSKILSNMLGKPIGQTFGKQASIKVYSLIEAGYRGYMAKVKIHDADALKVVLAGDRIKNKVGETTHSAAERTNATLAINAGGFWRNDDGYMYPLGINVVDGEIKSFSPSHQLNFIGINNEGKLIGGKIKSKEELEGLHVSQGVSFTPVLLQDGKKQKIPAKWANAKQPRTLIGHFANGDLLLIVIDGRKKGWSNGVTLEEAQDKLLEFNVVDAYTLDGGGSSTFVYDGKVLNQPSDGRERKVSSNIVIIP